MTSLNLAVTMTDFETGCITVELYHLLLEAVTVYLFNYISLFAAAFTIDRCLNSCSVTVELNTHLYRKLNEKVKLYSKVQRAYFVSNFHCMCLVTLMLCVECKALSVIVNHSMYMLVRIDSHGLNYSITWCLEHRKCSFMNSKH